ncbi:MAG: ExbD/TolR family protein [Myxococcota bacterium]
MAGGGGEQDLNLVPYMDILVNLMLFMLVVTAYIVELREAPVIAPAYSSGGSGDDDPNNKPKPFITVGITTKSFAILGSTDEVPAAEIVKNGEKYPYAELSGLLRRYKTDIEVAPNLVITADPAVPYKIVVETMDAVRTDKQGSLFPGVTLGLAVQ